MTKLKNFILTIQFFTRIPINVNIDVEEGDFAKGAVYLPLVGLIIGIINAFVFFISNKAFQNIQLAAILSVMSNIAVTGAFHLDGLADTCDGIFSSRKRERMLEIMKDSRIGTNGAAAIIFDILLRIATLSALPQKYIFSVIILSPVIAKTVVGCLMHISHYARKEDGLGSVYIGKVSRLTAVLCILIAGAIMSIQYRLSSLIPLFECLVNGFLYKKYMDIKIGGMTGDTLGGANEVIEIIFQLTLIIMWRCSLI